MTRKQRIKLHIVTDLVRTTEERAPMPSVNIDKRRITLPGLRFMGEEPHPAQDFSEGDAAMTDEEIEKLQREIEMMRVYERTHIDNLNLLRAEVERLTYELKRWKEVNAQRPDWEKLWAEQADRAEAAEAEVERLRAALELAFSRLDPMAEADETMAVIRAALMRPCDSDSPTSLRPAEGSLPPIGADRSEDR